MTTLTNVVSAGPHRFSAADKAAIQAEFALANALAAQAATIRVTVSSYTVGPLYSPQPNPGAAKVAAINAALSVMPVWYPRGLPAFLNLSQGATGATGYVSYRILTRNGVKLWNVPESYKLNEGDQKITDAMAEAAGGFRVMPSMSSPASIGNVGTVYIGGFIFPDDPRPWLPVGVIGAGYVPGISGKAITREAITGVAIVVGSVAAGVVAAPALFGTVGPAGLTGGVLTQGSIVGAGAGEAAGGLAVPSAEGIGDTVGTSSLTVAQSGLYDVAPGAYAVSGGAPVVTGGVSQAGILSGISLPSAEQLGGVALKTGATTLLGKLTQALAPKPKPKISAGVTEQQASQPFTSTLTGQLLIAVVGGLLVIILAKRFI